MTRNERRKATKLRLAAKQERFLGRVSAQRLENVREIVKSNLASPIVRDFPIKSCLQGMSGMSHRGYVCRAGGQMVRSRAMALATKEVNKPADRYAKPSGEDRSQWPVTHKV